MSASFVTHPLKWEQVELKRLARSGLLLLLTLAACAPEKPATPGAALPSPPAFFEEPYFDGAYSWKHPPYASPMTDAVLDAQADYRPICTERVSDKHVDGSSRFSLYTVDVKQFELAYARLAELLPVDTQLQLIQGIPIWVSDPNGKSVLDVEMCYSVKELSPRDALRAFFRSFGCAIQDGTRLSCRIDTYPEELVGPARISLDTGKVKARDALCQLLAALPVKCRVRTVMVEYEEEIVISMLFFFYKDGAPLSSASPKRYQYADNTERQEQQALNRAAETPWPDCSCE